MKICAKQCIVCLGRASAFTGLCLVAQWCLTLCNPMDCSPAGSSVHGDSPGKSAGVGCHALFQGIFPTQGLNPGLPCCWWILYHLSHQRRFHYRWKELHRHLQSRGVVWNDPWSQSHSGCSGAFQLQVVRVEWGYLLGHNFQESKKEMMGK